MVKLKEEVTAAADFQPKIEHLPKMLEFICLSAKKMGVPPSEIKKVELSCEEAIVNVIHYAYENSHGKIEVLCEGSKNQFSIHIIDEGKPFDPVTKELDIKKDEPIENRQIGGLGIYLIRELMDEVVYQRDDEKNHLTMTVRF